jgi:site-specific DNA-methyltransferase (adenine-specific)
MLPINTIHTGDSLALLARVDDASVDLHITSPMYADMKQYETSNGIHPDKYVEWFLPFVKEIERTLKPTGNFILNINDKVVDGFRHPYVFDLISEIHKQTGLKMAERLFWNKGKSLPNRSRFGDRVEYLFWFCKSNDRYFDIDAMRRPYNPVSLNRMKKPLKRRFARTAENQDAQDYKAWSPHPKGALPSTLVEIGSCATRQSNLHVAVFPEPLAEYFINGMTRPNDLVCDIFSGSGTSCRVAKRLNRQFLGMDICEEYNKEARLKLT